jgi:hypothetical protein
MKQIIGGALVALVLTACGSDEADIPAIESEIEQGIVDQTEVETEVDCPDSIEWKAGGDFRCFAEAEDGSSTRVTVYMENKEGEWSWQVE